MRKIIKFMLPALAIVLTVSVFAMSGGNEAASSSDVSIKTLVHTDESNIPEQTAEPIPIGEFTLTAYCPCVKCCEIWSAEHPSNIGTGFVQKTASGTIPTAGRTIAADTSVIPFDTIVLINGSEYTVEDRGGAIKGNRIDIFFNTHSEALQFGRQKAEVFIKN